MSDINNPLPTPVSGFVNWFVGPPTTGGIAPYSKMAAQAARAFWQQSRKGATPFISSMSNNTPLAAYGFTKMISGYAGMCLNVRRVSDNATLDIPFLADGIVDTNLMVAFSGASTLAVTKFYDQSGNVNDATQVTTANQPSIDLSTLRNGAPTMVVNGVHFLNIPAGVAITSTTNAAVWNSIGVFSNRTSTIPFMIGTTGIGINLVPFSSFSVQPVINNVQSTFNTMQSIPSTNGSVIGLNSSGSAITYYRNNYSVAEAAGTSAAAAGGTWPYNGAAFGGVGVAGQDQYSLVVFNAALSAADVILMQYGLSQSYSMVVVPTANVVFQGDSITDGEGAGFASYYWNYTKNMNEYLGNEISIYTVGLGGQTLVTEVSEVSQYVTPVFKSGIPNVAVMLGGVNDIAAGTSASTLETSITSWASTIHAAGGIAGMATLYPRNVAGGYTSAMQTQTNLLNAWIRANSGFGLILDFAIDVITEPTFNPAWSAADSPDNLHPSIQAYKKVAPLFAQQINNVIYGLVP